MPVPSVLTIQRGLTSSLLFCDADRITQAKTKRHRKVKMGRGWSSAVGRNLQKIENLHVPHEFEDTEFSGKGRGVMCEEACGKFAD